MARKFPRLLLWLLRLRLSHSSDAVLGDLIEEYNSGLRSRRWLWRQVFSTLLPGFRKSSGPYIKPETRRGMALFASVGGDLHYAARTLRQNPGFATIAVLAIALGIGVNTGIFTVLNGVALRPLPVADSDRLASVYQTISGLNSRNVHGSSAMFSASEYRYYHDHNQVFSGLLAYAPFLSVTLGGERPQHLFGQFTSCNYFEILHAPPALGRAFTASECAVAGANAVVVLNHDLWRNVFNSDPSIIGRKIILNRHPFTVIGVAPEAFQGASFNKSTFWVPYSMQQTLEPGLDAFPDNNMSWLILLGREKDGVSIAQVRADLGILATQIDRLSPGRKTVLAIQTATNLDLPEARRVVTGVSAVLLTAVGLVLLVACANVANLLLARATARQREISIRLAVGAGRGRLVRQLLTESLVIAVLGGAAGSLTAFWVFNAIMGFLVSNMPPGTPPLTINVGPDLRVLTYSLALSLATGIIFGLVPAFQATRPGLIETLKEGASSGRRSMGFMRNGLVAIQVAVSMVLLIAAGLLLRGLHAAQTVELGFNMNNIAVVSFDLKGQGYTQATAAAFVRQMAERVGGLPGVESVAQAGTVPLSDSHRGNGHVETNEVSPEFFSLLGIPIVRGRTFTAQETQSGAQVAIVSESTAAQLWPGQDPIGKVLDENMFGKYEIVGVSRSAQVSHLGRSNELYLYVPAGPQDQLRLHLLVRATSANPSISNGIRAVARALDPDLVTSVAKLEDNLEFWRAPSRVVAILAASLGGLSLLLASIGLYGVVSYAVNRRTREIGIRMTLGADRRNVMRVILGQTLWPVVVGSVAGITLCAAVSRILSAMLFGVGAHDPLAFIGVPVFLLVVAAIASFVPARRATKIDPMAALRYE